MRKSFVGQRELLVSAVRATRPALPYSTLTCGVAGRYKITAVNTLPFSLYAGRLLQPVENDISTTKQLFARP